MANNGSEVRPYAITRITTASGRVLYEREPQTPRVLVAPYVAANMTKLLQAAVETGTGRAAQIGRPLAGKTGTTSSNKDGWFLGFTPELTTGVWMGRDDARAVPGLQGGRAPARAFAAYMARAVGGTPPSALTTEVEGSGEMAMEPDDQVYGLDPQGDAPVTGVNGDIIRPQPEPVPSDGEQPRLDDRFLDQTVGEPGPR